MKYYQSPQTKLEKEREIEILDWNGIHKEENKTKKYREKYRFVICQFDCIALYQGVSSAVTGHPWMNSKRNKKQKWRTIPPHTSTREISRAKKIAIRALYVLGYDVGIIDIAIYRIAPKYGVLHIMEAKNVSETLQDALSKTIDQITNSERKSSKEAVLGADLEFVLRHTNGKYVLASRYLPKKGLAGYDAIWLRTNRKKHPLAELRPTASKNPNELMKNIYRCMGVALRKINNPQIEWLAGGTPLKNYPIGGHIHISGIQLNASIIRSLDNYLTLPLFLLESDQSMLRRPKYGFIGDYRQQFHGGFEYRTPPSWIISPLIARGVLTLAKVIAQDYQQLMWMPFHLYDVQKAFYQGNREYIYPIVQTLWDDLKKCPTYSTYKNYLDSFYQLIEQRFVWNEYEDIRKAWRLPPYK